MKFRHLALAASMLTMVGCADGPQLPAAPDDVRLSANPESNGVVQSINGNADIDTPAIPDVQPGGLRRLEINARRSADGTVSGKFTIRQQWGNEDTYDVDVVCFTIVANRAYVGGVLKAINGEPYVGHLAFRLIVEDGGEGANAAPDRASQVAAAGESVQPQAFCTNASLVLPMFPLARGNLAVRP